MIPPISQKWVPLDTDRPIWSRFFMIAPLAVVGTREADGYDLAPKHMITPMGFENYIGFVCTPAHGTYQNIEVRGEFTMSFPMADQVLISSLTASPRQSGISKMEQIIDALPTCRAAEVDALFLEQSYLMLECKHFRTIDGFGGNSLITGTILHAYVHPDYLRVSEQDEQQLLHEHPLLAYVAEGRFSRVAETYHFPFPKGFNR
ncbi:flavin reductase [Robiginitalea aurantiaca]|uniref:Flavin reductase n=1 Tax=Robiginitalea aurantiaca TaxID=3056915 RepID=A0ABT7WH66_9FLAO|nr:flavin reductase [Robiginitalea aurantiaca]MDM9632267.1 flavin reductase [Robiginitalea aurantiaca]